MVLSALRPDLLSLERSFLARARRAGVCAAGGARGKDAHQLARELLAMSQEEFSRAFRKSPMRRAKLRE